MTKLGEQQPQTASVDRSGMRWWRGGCCSSSVLMQACTQQVYTGQLHCSVTLWLR